MKKIFILFFLILFVQNLSFAGGYKVSDLKVFPSGNNKYYGLKDKANDKIIVEANYKKVIMLGNNSWLVQNKKNRFGLIDCDGNVLVPLKYIHAERLYDKWVKLGNDSDYGIYDEYGVAIVPPKYNGIEPLFGNRFLTYKHYKYGIYNSKGEELLENKCDFIYMPTPKKLRIKYDGTWYEIEPIPADDNISIPDAVIKEVSEEDLKLAGLVKNTGLGASYGLVTATDYTLKIFSAISNAYEDTIDELMLSKGVETVSIFVKLNWIPKFPVVFAKKYYDNIFKPENSPLSGIRSNIMEQIKE